MKKLLLIVFISFFIGICQTKAQDATVIYIHGVLNQDFNEFNKTAYNMHKDFKNLNVKNYNIKDDYALLFWGWDARYKKIESMVIDYKTASEKFNSEFYVNKPPFESFKCGLYELNNTDNKINPIISDTRLLRILGKSLSAFVVNRGSSILSSNIRNIGHYFVYDAFWAIENSDDLNKHLKDLIENRIKGPYIIAAHSAGTIVAVNFLNDVIVSHPNSDISNQFVGMITFGSPIETIKPELFESKQTPFVKYFRKGNNELNTDKFWINVAHSNDIIASGLTSDIWKDETYNIDDITIPAKTRLYTSTIGVFQALSLGTLTFLDNKFFPDSSITKAHGWYWKKSDKFTDLIDKGLKDIKFDPNQPKEAL